MPALLRIKKERNTSMAEIFILAPIVGGALICLALQCINGDLDLAERAPGGKETEICQRQN